MGRVGAPFYRVTSTDFKCADCGTPFEIYWPELDGGKPTEVRAVCPLAGCEGEARPIRDNYVVDLPKIIERLEHIESMVWPRRIARSNLTDARGRVQVLISCRTPLRLGVLEALSRGPARYSDLQKRLDVQDPSLIRVLRVLTSSELVRKGTFRRAPYELTEEGRKALDKATAQT